MTRHFKTFEFIFSKNNLSCTHISAMWHSLNVYKYFCPLSVFIESKILRNVAEIEHRIMELGSFEKKNCSVCKEGSVTHRCS